MWTYMMAASRGDRTNSMLPLRRRNECESPKYGYNQSRPMYRTTSRINTPSSTATTMLGSAYLQAPVYASTSNSVEHFPSRHRRSWSPNTNFAEPNVLAASDEGTSLFSPLTTTSTAVTAADKDTSIFICNESRFIEDEGSRHLLHHKHLISNQNSKRCSTAKAAAAVMRIPCTATGDNVAEDDFHLSAIEEGQQRMAAGYEQQSHFGDSDDSDFDDFDDNDNDDDDDEAGKGNFVENTLENGKRWPKEQSKQSKPSIVRRTLHALRRLRRRKNSKPPDWFLEKFSNTANKDKIGKSPNTRNADGGLHANNDALASEIHGTNLLCNRLSVDPTLQSHYRWLSIVSLAVFYNIIFVVGRAVFWEINKNGPVFWYILDYLCDFIYLSDTLVHMHEGYLEQGLLVRDAYKLRRHYFSTKGWTIDLLSMLPTDLAYIWWSPSECSPILVPCAEIVRLNRLLRLPRMWQWFDRTETATGYPNAFRICKVVLAILVLIHWNACLYFYISYAIGFSSDNWVYNLNGYRNATLTRQYIYSFYWSTLTLTTIGETPVPENDVEYLFVVADFLAGVLIFATIVGNIGSMISNMNVARVEFQNRMDGVKQYMAFRRVGHELEARVIRWFAYTWSQSGALDEERVLSALPDKLKAEIAIQVHMDTLKQVDIFRDCEPGLLEALVLKLKLQVFSPGDYICRKGDVGKEMYIVKRGKLSVVGDDGITVLATLGAGSVFGEVSVLEIAGNRTGNRRTANVRSLGYSDLFCLAKRDLWETLGDYPDARATLTERGCQLLRKDGLLDEVVFADSQRAQDSIESGMEKLEVSVDNLNVRLARLLAEYAASQAKLKQRIAKLEQNLFMINDGSPDETRVRQRGGRLYSLQPKKRPRPQLALTASKSIDSSKQNTLKQNTL